MKRILPLILTVLLLPTLLAVPAMADESDFPNYWIELLEYGYAIGYSSNFIPLTGASTSISYSNPGGGELEYCEILLKTDSTSFRVGTWNAFLSITSLGNGVYLAYGNLANGTNNATIGEFFFRDYDGSFVEILSFKVSRKGLDSYSKTCSGIVYRGGNSNSGQRPIVFPSDPTYGLDSQVIFDNTGNPDMYYRAQLVVSEWESMDFIQLNLSSYCKTIDSITVQINGILVPYKLNDVTTTLDSGIVLSIIDLLIDIRQFPNGTNSSIDIILTGTVGANQTGDFRIQNCFGIVESKPASLWAYWFTQVGNWFSQQTSALVSPIVTWGQNIVNSVSSWGQAIVDAVSGSADTSQMEQDVQQAQQDLNNAQDAMNDFTLPAAGSVIPDVSGELELGADSHFGSMMAQFFLDPLITRMVTAGVAFMLFGVILG